MKIRTPGGLWLRCGFTVAAVLDFVLSAKRSPSICLRWVYKKLLRSSVTGIHALAVLSGVFRWFSGSVIYEAP